LVGVTERSNTFGEGPTEERHVEHPIPIGRLARMVKRPTEVKRYGRGELSV
jgi:hypothetical protein